VALTASEVATLKSSLETWEVVGYMGSGFVLFGVVGEFVAEFAKFAETSGAPKRLAKFATLVLIIGLAGEFLGQVKASRLSGYLIASLEERVADATTETESIRRDSASFGVQVSVAKKDAAEANARAKQYEAGIMEANARANEANATVEGIKRDNLALQAGIAKATADATRARSQIAKAVADAAQANARALEASVALARLKVPRTLGVEQKRRLASKVRTFPGQLFTFTVCPDPESLDLMREIKMVLTASGWIEAPSQLGDVGIGQAGMVFTVGVEIQMPLRGNPTAWERAKLLASVLSAEGIPATATLNPELKNPLAINIMVGKKPF
jgi:hypothetical protein